MIRVLGGPKRLCDGLTRRDLLQIGSAGLLGLGLSGGAAPGAVSSGAGNGFGKAKACILLFLYGSPSQLETFDPKPEAPERIAANSRRSRPTSPAWTFANCCPRWPR